MITGILFTVILVLLFLLIYERGSKKKTKMADEGSYYDVGECYREGCTSKAQTVFVLRGKNRNVVRLICKKHAKEHRSTVNDIRANHDEEED